MLADVSVDPGTVALLAAVVWLDGWRRAPDGAVLVERFAFGPWRVSRPSVRVGPFALVAWWAPITIPVLLEPESPQQAEAPRARSSEDFESAVADAKARLHKVRWAIRILRALGIVLIVWIIVGIPTATALFAGAGLIHGVLDALGLAVVITLVATAALMSLGTRFGRSFRMAAQLLSPFTAPRAAEIVTSAAVESRSSIARIAALLGDTGFLAWIRPWAYDALEGRGEPENAADEAIGNLVRGLPRHVLERAVTPVLGEKGDDAVRYCPRCMSTYRETAEQCSDCGDLALLEVGAR